MNLAAARPASFRFDEHLDTYHGYVQDFLDIDTRFGTRQDLVDLIHRDRPQGR